MIIDVHRHCIPTNFLQFIARHGDKYGVNLEKDGNGQEWLRQKEGYVFELTDQLVDPKRVIADMRETQLDLCVLSMVPTLLFYGIEPYAANEICKVINDGIRDLILEHPGSFVGMGTLPLQDTTMALAELDRISDNGIKTLQIGAHVEGKTFDHPDFLPLFEAIEEKDLLVFIHPYFLGPKKMLEKYYLTNLLGNPIDTSIAASSLIFGGVLDKFPKLKLVLAHGGGFLPYQRGRLEHGYNVRQEPKAKIGKPPSEYLKLMYFDTILHDNAALQFLIETVGSDRVVIGSDYPFDMGDLNPVATVNSLALSEVDSQNILGDNAKRLLNL